MSELDVSVDHDLCMGVASCVYRAPQLFAMDDETNQAVVIGTPPGDENEMSEIAQVCPNDAVVVKAGDRIVWPV